MMINHVRLALRAIRRNPLFSAINIFGLALGVLAFGLIAQYVSFQLSFDQFHSNKEEVYRVAYARYINGELKNVSAKHVVGIRSLIEQNFPNVECTGFWPIPANTDFTFRYDGKTISEPGKYLFADSNFLKVFSDRLINGDLKTVMSDPHNLIISEKMSRKIFGDRDPVGLAVEDIADSNNDGPELVVAGVMKDFPENSHLRADFLSPMDHSWDTVTYYWDVPSFYTYARIHDDTDIKRFESRLNALLKETAKEHEQMVGVQAFLQPVTSIHLESNLSDELESNGSSTLIYILGLIGVIILVTAWINYINLETARLIIKSKEVGIRRIIGSTQADVAFQFLINYACLILLATVLAGIGAYACFPYFSVLTGVPQTWAGIFEPQILTLVFSIFVAGSVVAGIYPALYILNVNPTKILKGTVTGIGSARIRKGLVSIQFCVSLILIGFLMVVVQQLDFMRLTNKKIEIDQVVAIKNPMAYVDDTIDDQTKFNEFASKVSQYAPVQMVSTSSAIPGTEIGFTLVNEMKQHAGDPYDPTRFKLLFVDYNYLSLYKLKLLAGRDYSLANGPDENKDHIILNETAIHALGFDSPKQAVGERVHFPLWKWMKPETEIIGVVEDYHHEAIKRPVMPMIFFLNNAAFQQVFYSVKLNAGSDPQLALRQIEKTWREVYPERSFQYFFIDDFYDQQFKSELQFGWIFGVFAVIAIVLGCLGIFGMTIFYANSRLKEISIRKVIGASLRHLWVLLSAEYFKVAAVSTLIAWPLIYMAADSWLQNYPARISLSAIFFVIPAVVILAMIVFTSFFHTLKAAQANPVDHLKSE